MEERKDQGSVGKPEVVVGGHRDVERVRGREYLQVMLWISLRNNGYEKKSGYKDKKGKLYSEKKSEQNSERFWSVD